MDITVHVKNNGIFLFSSHWEKENHYLCKSMIEMVSDNIAMQKKKSMCVQESSLDCYTSGGTYRYIWKRIMFTKDDWGIVSGVHDESHFWFGV